MRCDRWGPHVVTGGCGRLTGHGSWQTCGCQLCLQEAVQHVSRSLTCWGLFSVDTGWHWLVTPADKGPLGLCFRAFSCRLTSAGVLCIRRQAEACTSELEQLNSHH